MEEKELEKYLINFVLEFGSKMNALEREINEKSDNNPGKDYFEEFGEKYLPIFQEYCSNKKRAYGGKADSYGIPTRYDGIENAIEKKATIKNRNRVEVYFKTPNDFDAEYLFVALRKNDIWKIDSLKYKWYGNEKWKPQIL